MFKFKFTNVLVAFLFALAGASIQKISDIYYGMVVSTKASILLLMTYVVILTFLGGIYTVYKLCNKKISTE